ncbi:Panacea domain-containing protein [Burkholderia gladioli]|uniref:Panacea domain-containing protein n=1 Tax=Burkholderia gladioli TaxID=28095 RepID=UPI00163F8978|nr:type II toxin-antitoxin system antitoxin SocA domain-containing protein [Burkholderia gladioli]MDN7806934.1 DUF4065 domain-containing protein [Burkholderia gladioli]
MAKFTPIDVAAWFLNRQDLDAGDPITHLKLQKLVYYAQAWCLAMLNEPLFDEDLEAWAHGPVSRSLYDKYAGAKWNPLEAPGGEDAGFSAEQVDILQEVKEAYGRYASKRLEAMTHNEQPWLDARGSLGPEERSNAKISKETMGHFYKDLLEKTTAEE